MPTNLPTAYASSPFKAGAHLRWRSRALHAAPVLLLVMGFGLAFAPVAHADVAHTETDEFVAAPSNAGGNGTWVQGLGTGLGDTTTGVTLYLRMTNVPGYSFLGVNAGLIECDDGTYTTCTVPVPVQYETFPGQYDNVARQYTWTWDTPYALDPDKYYALTVQANRGSGAEWWLYGSGSDTYDQGAGSLCGIVASWTSDSCGDVEDMYFILLGANVGGNAPEGDGVTTSHVIRINSPLSTASSETTVASTTFAIDFDYIVDAGDGYNANGIEIAMENLGGAGGIYYERFSLVDLGWNSSEFDEVVINEELEVTAPFAGTYKVTVRLIGSEAFYNAPPYTFGVVNPIWTVDAGKTTYLHVVSEDYDLWGTVTPTTGYTIYSEDSCDLNLNPFDDEQFFIADCIGLLLTPTGDTWAAYGNLDDQIMSRFPFSYAPQLNAVRNAIYGNEAATPPAIAVTILGGELTLLSRDMVAAVPFASAINAFLTALIWLLLIYALYAMVLKMHDNKTEV